MWSSVESQIRPIVDKIETYRKESWPKILRYTLLIGVGISVVVLLILFIIFGYHDAIEMSPLLIVAAIIGFVGAYACTYYHYYDYVKTVYKTEIMPMLVSAVCDNGEYVPNGGVDEYVFRLSGLFSWDHTTELKQEDYIRGVIDKTDFEFCEAELSHEETTTDQKGRTTTQKVTDFRGMVFSADFNKNFNGQTIISTSHVSTFYRRIKLESVDFNKKFYTYCTDEIEARYILSPALQERMLCLYNTLYRTMSESSFTMSFKNNRLTIFIRTYKDRFEPTMYRKMSIEKVEKDFACIEAMVGVVEDLNLNTRIWTKE